jgi:hypothetical protein
MKIITPKDFEDACATPALISTIVDHIVLLPLHMLGMYTLFLKADKIFNPNRKQRERAFMNRIAAT